jgi:RNA polymerase sigma-70 factor (ECF subfamily)
MSYDARTEPLARNSRGFRGNSLPNSNVWKGESVCELMESPERFEQIALPHLDNVYRAAVAVCRRTDEAEDLTQTTFLKAFERFDMFKPGTNCKAWLLQIMRNLWIDRVRHRQVTGTAISLDEELLVIEPKVDTAPWSEARDFLENFSDEQVIQALKRLSPNQRLTLYLMDVEQLSEKEVAEITATALGTVKSRTCRARRQLKKHLQAYAREMGFVGRNR